MSRPPVFLAIAYEPLRRLYLDLLSMRSLQALCVATDDEAVLESRQRQPGVLVVDMEPGLDAARARCVRLKSAAGDDCRLIVLLHVPSKDLEQVCLESGASDVLPLTDDSEFVAGRIAYWAGKSEAEESSAQAAKA
ncbi:MAG: hypothetical protein RIE31_04055 [Alphaproteobacteria bacterium]